MTNLVDRLLGLSSRSIEGAQGDRTIQMVGGVAVDKLYATLAEAVSDPAMQD